MAESAAVVTSRTPDLERESEVRRRAWLHALTGNPVTLICAGLLLLVVLASLFAPLLTSHDPTFLDPGVRLQGPSRDYWFGTDDRGRDVFSRSFCRYHRAPG